MAGKHGQNGYPPPKADPIPHITGLAFAHSNDMDKFNDQVKDLLADGFKPLERPFRIHVLGEHGIHFTQAFQKRETSDGKHFANKDITDQMLIHLDGAQAFNKVIKKAFDEDYVPDLMFGEPQARWDAGQNVMVFTMVMVKGTASVIVLPYAGSGLNIN